MAINKSEFKEKVDIGLKANKTFTQFYYRFKIEGKEYSKLFDYTDKTWDKRTRVAKAKADALEFKDIVHKKRNEITIGFDEDSTLNEVAKAYFDKECSSTQWTQERQDAYRLYLLDTIGKKKIKSIRLHDINTVRTSMETKGYTKQTQNGCSPRTIKKVLIQTLKPIMEYAYDNKVISDIPKIELSRHYVKANKAKKKIVLDAGAKLATLYKVIMETYKDDPFYRALFLFALYGRRWGEIKTFNWDDIFFSKNIYRIKEENSKIRQEQFFELPEPIREALEQMNDDRQGLIFKSPITKGILATPKRQLAKIKELSNIPELTMHYFRHILVSAMGELGTASTILSASLGHTNLNTVNQFYLSANYKKASQITNQTIKQITNIESLGDDSI
jgi:integrase